ncbi:MAG TPA: hypothetical protein VGM29_01325 [Polyangiaceae bacterium]|jgi:hypothetical protein
MERRWLGFLAFAAMACGPTYGGQDVKTPEQLLEEQERLGDEQLNKEKTSGPTEAVGSTEDEKKREWDVNQSTLEMKRAARSAETCPESVTEKAPKGKCPVSLTFANDGHVKEVTVGSPYTDGAVGKCVERAMKAVVVPAYTGSEHKLDWEIDLTGGKKSVPVGSSDDKKDDSK